MSDATERIRAMLDERGVEWWDMKTRGVWFGISGREHRFEAYEQTDGLIALNIYDLTPEQAIEATLGRGECKLTHTRDKPRSKAPTLTCSECGWWTDRINDEWRYCPSCGKRVKA